MSYRVFCKNCSRSIVGDDSLLIQMDAFCNHVCKEEYELKNENHHNSSEPASISGMLGALAIIAVVAGLIYGAVVVKDFFDDGRRSYAESKWDKY